MPEGMLRYYSVFLIFSICSFLGLNSYSSDVQKCTSLRSSVLLFSWESFDSCAQKVRRAHELGSTDINILVNAFFETDGKGAHARALCWRTRKEEASGRSSCHPDDRSFSATVKKQLGECFTMAESLEMDISLIIHLDDLQHRLWRNQLVFDPLETYQKIEYFSHILNPLAQSLNDHLKSPKTHVELSIQGEMGATVFHFPEQYQEILRRLRGNWTSPARLDLGLGFNFNKVAGQGYRYSRKQMRAAQRLFDQVDFVGVSAYHGFTPKAEPEEFNASVDSMLRELKRLRIRIPKDMPIHLAEVGLGGGDPSSPRPSPAKSVREAARAPWAGVGTVREGVNNPWAKPELRAFRRRYHQNLLAYLSSTSKKYSVTSANLWSMGSWDPQGLFIEGQYRDPELVEAIRAHNQACRSQFSDRLIVAKF